MSPVIQLGRVQNAGAMHRRSISLTHSLTCLVEIGDVQYVLVGAGTASFAAAKAIREKDPKAKVRTPLLFEMSS